MAEGSLDDAAGQAEPAVGAINDAELSRSDALYAFVRNDTHFVFTGTLQGTSGKFGRVTVFECDAGRFGKVAQRISGDESETGEVELGAVLCVGVEAVGDIEPVVFDVLAYDKPRAAT